LIEQNILPESAADSVHLFSSQPCENIFRDTRSLSRVYSTRINFTMRQFLKRINKLNALTELKHFESINEYDKIIFPIHHKIKQVIVQTGSNTNNKDINFNTDDVETIILKAYQVAQQMAIYVGMSVDLIKNNLFSLQQSSKLAKELLKSNSLTESEILIIDDKNSDSEDDSDEDDDEEDVSQEAIGQEADRQEAVDEEDGGGDSGEEADDEGDYIEESDDGVYDYVTSQDNTEPTSSFKNLQSTSYAGVY
jgi:hypothetical protein